MIGCGEDRKVGIEVGSILVPNLHPPTAKLAIVGEAPGENEEENKEPFWPTARAGEKLANCLGRQGVERHEVYLGNLFKFRPPGNKFKSILTHELLPIHTKELHDELLQLKPNVILACGNWPMYFLTGKHGFAHGKAEPGTGITHWRGSILPCTLPGLESTKVIPTYHPSFIARNAKLYPVFDLDVRRAVQDSQFPDFRLPDRKLIINPTSDEIEQAVIRFSTAKLLSFDIETFGDKLACVGFSDDPFYAICIPWGTSRFGDDAILRLLTSDIPKVPHFGFFDISYLKWYYQIEVKNWFWDTFIAQRVLQPELPRTLEYLTSIYTREPYYKYTGREILEDTKSWGRDDVSLNQLWIYNCKDAATTLEIALQQQVEIIESQKVVTSAGWWYKRHVKTMAFEMDQARELCLEISEAGMLVDSIRQKELRDILIKKWAKHQTDLNNLTGQFSKKIETIGSLLEGKPLPPYTDTPVLFNPNSNTQCPALLYGVYKLTPRKSRKKDDEGQSNVTTDEDAIIGLIAEVKKEYDTKVRPAAKNRWLVVLLVLKKILIVRGIRKKLSSYIDIQKGEDGRVRSLFKLGPETARWSASKWIDRTGLNLQTIPRDSVEDV